MNYVSTDIRSAMHVADAKHITAWLLKLASLVRKSQGDGDRSQIAEYVEFILRRNLPTDAFDRDSLAYVVDGSEWWPAVSPLADKIAEYWAVTKTRRQNAQFVQIEGPRSSAVRLSENDERWRRYWVRHEQTNWVEADETGITDAVIASRRKIGLSMVKRYAPAAYEQIVGSQVDDIATWTNENRLRSMLAALNDHPFKQVMLRCIQAAVTHRAPRLLGMVETALLDAGMSIKPEPKRLPQ